MANRRALDRALAQGIAKATLILVDLNGFKAVNDTLGHAAGDELLVATAQRLLSVVRRGDLVVRLGGDEFAILLHASPAVPERTLRQLHQVLGEPVLLADGNTARVSASIGVAAAHPATTGDELLRQADREMYRAKEAVAKERDHPHPS